jgi:hypothetical protein
MGGDYLFIGLAIGLVIVYFYNKNRNKR